MLMTGKENTRESERGQSRKPQDLMQRNEEGRVPGAYTLCRPKQE